MTPPYSTKEYAKQAHIAFFVRLFLCHVDLIHYLCNVFTIPKEAKGEEIRLQSHDIFPRAEVGLVGSIYIKGVCTDALFFGCKESRKFENQVQSKATVDVLCGNMLIFALAVSILQM